MKNFAVDEIRSIIKEIKNSDDKKCMYVVLGVLAAVSIAAMGITAMVLKKRCLCCDDYRDFDDWDEIYDEDDKYSETEEKSDEK